MPSLQWILPLALFLAGCAAPASPALEAAQEQPPGSGAEPPSNPEPSSEGPATSATDAMNATGNGDVVLTSFKGTTRGVDALGMGAGCPGDVPGCDNHLSVEVAEDATALLIEVTWEGDPLSLYLFPVYAECKGAAPFTCHEDLRSATSPARFLVDTPAPSGGMDERDLWHLAIYPGTASAFPVAFSAYASVFYGSPPPADYTAIPPPPP